MNDLENNEKKSFFEKYKNYIEVFVVLFVATCVIACFLPICNGGYLDYLALLEPNPDEIDEQQANQIKENAQVVMSTENNISDSLEIKREVSDVINGFIYYIKKGEYDNAYKLLASPSYTSDINSIKYNIEDNKGYAFFANYLNSFEVTINQVTVLDDCASANISIKRFDINRMVNKLISEKMQDENPNIQETYETVLYEYEQFLKEEFSKTNPYTKTTDYIIGLVKENWQWKLVNDDDFNSNILNMEFKISKSTN